MLNTIFKLFFNIKTLGILYLALFIYNNFLGVYPRVIFYHLRGAMEWIDQLIPISTQIGVFTIVISIGVVVSLAKKIL